MPCLIYRRLYRQAYLEARLLENVRFYGEETKCDPDFSAKLAKLGDIYVNDAYDNWNEISGPDALLYPYCRNNDSGSHAQMEKHFLNGN